MSKKYNIIYADPPWRYETFDKRNVVPYPVMKDEDIKNLPIQNIADKDCILFMWATFPKLELALETIKAWGFKYRSLGFSWIKKNKKSDSYFWGMGYWTRQNCEVCLIATKGKPHRKSMGVHSVIATPIEEHSKKPDIVRDKIVELMGDLPRVELFCRHPAQGWDSIGNEIDGKDIREVLQCLK
jgi:N6-adenosine-specific RNA methylase IME4